MRNTLALLLAAGFLYLVPFAPLPIKTQTLAASSKFQTVANPIPNRYIVVLATTARPPDTSTPMGATNHSEGVQG